MRFFSYQTLLAACHFCSDINQSALAAVLPFLVAAYHYDYATAAMLVLSSNIIGSLIQPLLGTLSDKHNWPWIMPLGLFMAGGGIALTGVTSDFYLLCLFTMISGIGVAMFHPQGALMVNRVSTDDNRGISLSVFSFGGNMGLPSAQRSSLHRSPFSACRARSFSLSQRSSSACSFSLSIPV